MDGRGMYTSMYGIFTKPAPTKRQGCEKIDTPIGMVNWSTILHGPRPGFGPGYILGSKVMIFM